MKKILLVALVCFSSLSFAAESQLGEASASSGNACQQAINDNCDACKIKNCPQQVVSDRVIKDANGSVKSSQSAKGASKQ